MSVGYGLSEMLVRRLGGRFFVRLPAGLDFPVLAAFMVSEFAPAEPSAAAAILSRAIAKLLPDAVQLLLADIAGLDATSKLFSLALSLPKLANLVSLRWRGLKGRWDRQSLYIGLSLT